MKIFAIMLLMLYSFSFLKAQTMVVETADTVESFKVGEIKSLSAFEKQYERVKIEFKNIPVVVKDRHNNAINLIYSGWQISYGKPFFKDGVLKTPSGFCAMNYQFIDDDDTKSGTGTLGETQIKFDTLQSIIQSFNFKTSGSMGGCYENNFGRKPTCVIYGNMEINFSNLLYIMRSNSVISATLKAQEILSKLNKFEHGESTSNFDSSPGREFSLKEIRKAELTDDSQIIITVE